MAYLILFVHFHSLAFLISRCKCHTLLSRIVRKMRKRRAKLHTYSRFKFITESLSCRAMVMSSCLSYELYILHKFWDARLFVLNYAYKPGKCVCIIVEEKSDLRRIAFNGVGFHVRDMSMNAAEIIGSCRLRRRSNITFTLNMLHENNTLPWKVSNAEFRHAI